MAHGTFHVSASLETTSLRVRSSRRVYSRPSGHVRAVATEDALPNGLFRICYNYISVTKGQGRSWTMEDGGVGDVEDSTRSDASRQPRPAGFPRYQPLTSGLSLVGPDELAPSRTDVPVTVLGADVPSRVDTGAEFFRSIVDATPTPMAAPKNPSRYVISVRRTQLPPSRTRLDPRQMASENTKPPSEPRD